MVNVPQINEISAENANKNLEENDEEFEEYSRFKFLRKKSVMIKNSLSRQFSTESNNTVVEIPQNTKYVQKSFDNEDNIYETVN